MRTHGATQPEGHLGARRQHGDPETRAKTEQGAEPHPHKDDAEVRPVPLPTPSPTRPSACSAVCGLTQKQGCCECDRVKRGHTGAGGSDPVRDPKTSGEEVM